MVDLSRRTYKRNDIEKIVDNDGILWLNEKHIEEGVDNENLRKVTVNYHSDHRKHRGKLTDQPKKKCNRKFIDEKLAMKVIMDGKPTWDHKFRTRVGFKQYDVVLTKEQSVLTNIIMSSFEGENIQTLQIMF